jgi:hypothetical protein
MFDEFYEEICAIGRKKVGLPCYFKGRIASAIFLD